MSGLISPHRCQPLPPLPRVVHPPPLLIMLSPAHPLFYLIVVCWIGRDGADSTAAGRRRWRRQRSGGGSGSTAIAAVQRQRGGGAAAARWRRGIGGSGGGSLAAARRQRGGGGSFPSAWRRWQNCGGGNGVGSSVAAVVAGWQQRGGGKQRGVVFLCLKRICLAPLASCAVSIAAMAERFFAPEGGPDYALWTAQDFALRSH